MQSYYWTEFGSEFSYCPDLFTSPKFSKSRPKNAPKYFLTKKFPNDSKRIFEQKKIFCPKFWEGTIFPRGWGKISNLPSHPRVMPNHLAKVPFESVQRSRRSSTGRTDGRTDGNTDGPYLYNLQIKDFAN